MAREGGQLYTSKWTAIISYKEPISVAGLQPGNFYKINSYKYADGTTRALSGPKTSYIFLLGKFTSGKDVLLSAVKLNRVNPEWFFADLRLALRFNPLTADEIDRVEEETQNDTTTFSRLLKRFPKDGRPIFNIIKGKRRIYEGNYREYKVRSVLSAEYVEVSSDYLKSILTKDWQKTKEKLGRDDATDERDANVKDYIAKDKPQKI